MNFQLLERKLWETKFPGPQEYGHPVIPSDPELKSEVFRVTDKAKALVSRRLLERGLPELPNTRYVSASDIALPYFIGVNTPEGRYIIPKGEGPLALYDDYFDGIVLDEAGFQKTRKNEELKDIYKTGMNTAKRLESEYPELRDSMEDLKELYEQRLYMLNRPPLEQAVHETCHSLIKKAGLDKYLSKEENEALTEVLTEETIGEASPEGTSYDFYKKKMRLALDYLGVDSGFDVIKACAHGECEGMGTLISSKYRSLNPAYA